MGISIHPVTFYFSFYASYTNSNSPFRLPMFEPTSRHSTRIFKKSASKFQEVSIQIYKRSQGYLWLNTQIACDDIFSRSVYEF